jgi:hypothetical protein
MIVSCLFPASTDGRMIATVRMKYVATSRTDWGEIANVEIVIVHTTTAIHVAVNRLLASVTTSTMMEPSLVELIGSYLT